MRCKDVEKLSSAYLDGELDERASSAVRGHLRTCQSCCEAVEDEARLVAAAAELEPAEPPAEMWSAIEDRLAEAEIADAERPRWWLWWHAARPYLGGAALAGVAAAALLLWQQGGDSPGATASAAEPPPVALVSSRSHAEAAQLELSRADRRYQDTIAELRAIAEAERAGWSADEVAAFDARLAELDARIVAERARLSVGGAGDAAAAAPAGRDPLYAAYQAQIEVLSAAAVGDTEAW